MPLRPGSVRARSPLAILFGGAGVVPVVGFHPHIQEAGMVPPKEKRGSTNSCFAQLRRGQRLMAGLAVQAFSLLICLGMGLQPGQVIPDPAQGAPPQWFPSSPSPHSEPVPGLLLSALLKVSVLMLLPVL